LRFVDVELEEGKKNYIFADLRELTNTELILTTDDETSSGNIGFILGEGCKSKDYNDVNVFIEWQRLKKV
jgi:hypothetical protein